MLAAPFPALHQALATVLRFHLVKESLPHNAAVCVCVCVSVCVCSLLLLAYQWLNGNGRSAH